MKHQNEEELFDRFGKAVRSNSTLDTKTTALLHLAAAMALGCQP